MCSSDLLLGISGTLDILLKNTLSALSGADAVQFDVRRLRGHNCRLLRQAGEGRVLDRNLGGLCQSALIIGLDAASTRESGLRNLSGAAVVPQVVLAAGGISKLAVDKHRLAVLVVARAIGERAVGVRYGVVRRIRIAQDAGKILGRMTDVTHPSPVAVRQSQVHETDINVIILVR